MRSDDRQVLARIVHSDPIEWLEKNFYIEDPRDPNTGEIFDAGPIRLAPHQKKIIRYAFTRINGKFPYVTVVYSTIKKSGKTRIAAGLAAWFAATQGGYGEVYCLANDGKQSKDRILSAIRKAVDLNPNLGWRTTQTKVTLPDGTVIEAIPCDAAGQAGSNPSLTVWSEMWGYRQRHQERLWTEMTVPPTRWGHAMRLVESYAGYSGESHVLENLYNLGKEDGILHPAFKGPNDPPVYVNPTAKMFCYWDQGKEARRMPWQSEDYYEEEAATLRPSEFRRIHGNFWVDPVEKAIPIEWWDNCSAEVQYKDQLPPLDSRTPIVLAADAAITKDCCALVGVSRNPFIPKRKAEYHRQSAVRFVRVWQPPIGGRIDLTKTLEKAIREACKRYNVIECCYDKYQLEKLMRDLNREGLTNFKEFSQSGLRAVADNQLYTQIIHKRIAHNGETVLRAHVDNAAAKKTGEKIRFIKMDEGEQFGRTRRPIDALVALSMGNYRCLKLIL